MGDGMTRWVDGHFALSGRNSVCRTGRPGRLFARAGVLSGDSVHTVRLRCARPIPTCTADVGYGRTVKLQLAHWVPEATCTE